MWSCLVVMLVSKVALVLEMPRSDHLTLVGAPLSTTLGSDSAQLSDSRNKVVN